MDTIVYLAGSSWDSVTGTDKNLALALARDSQVLWVDPPQSVLRVWRGGKGFSSLQDVADGVVRLRTLGPPGVTKPVLRRFSEHMYHQRVRAAVKGLGLDVTGTLCASPIMTFVDGVAGNRLHFVTDDWLSGATLMGFSRRHVRRILGNNARRSTVVAAVSEYLAQDLARELGTRIEVLPNGCQTRLPSYAADPGHARAALVGQLNERLDLEVLEAVAQTGIYIAVAGPVTAKSAASRAGLERFLARPNVHWQGALDSEGVAQLLSSSNVGLTPYRDTRFNRCSFPLKTLEYIAAGVPVVAADLPASVFPPGAKVRLASNPADFARAVTEVSAVWPSDLERALQAEQVKAHTWDKRALRVRALLSDAPAQAGPTPVPLPMNGGK